MIQLEIGNSNPFATGRPYENFLDISVQIALDSLVGEFQFEATSTPVQQEDFPIKAGQACRILINNVAVIVGFVEVISVSHDALEHSITIQGRDKTADVVDSTLGGEFGKNQQTISLVQFTKEVLAKAGIDGIDVATTVDNMKSFGVGEILDAETGDSVFSYLEQYARKRQVLLTTDSNGNILYQQASGIADSGTQLISLPNNGSNNILSAFVTNDISKLYHQYFVRSQSNLGAANLPGIPDAEQSTSEQGIAAFDSIIRSSRILNMIADTSSSSGDCTERALWQRNISRAQAFQYNAIVQGHTTPDGMPWKLNRLINIRDTYCDVDGDLLLNSIEWKFSNKSGSITSLGFVPKDSYTLEIAEPVVDPDTSGDIDISSFLSFIPE